MAKRTRPAKPNVGARQLARLTIPQTELAQVFGVSQPCLAQWTKGVTKPAPAKRQIAFERYAISVASWDEPFVPEVAPQPELALSIPQGAIGKAQMLESFATSEMARIQRDTTATPKEKAAVMKLCAETLHKLAALTGEHDLGSRILETPMWARIKSALGDALGPFPEASAACAAALRRIEASG